MVVGKKKTFGGLSMWTVRGIGKNINSPIIARFTLKESTFKDIFKKRKSKFIKRINIIKWLLGYLRRTAV